MTAMLLGMAAELAPRDGLKIAPTNIADPKHPDALRLLAYWKSCECRGGLRLGRDLPAKGIASLMSRLSVLEPINDMQDFVFRLAGTGWFRRFGRDIQGERLSGLYAGGNLRHYIAGLQNVLKSGKPSFVDVRVRDAHRERHHIEYAEFPVWAPSRETQCVLAGAFHFDASG